MDKFVAENLFWYRVMRLAKELEQNAPSIIIINELRLIRESCDNYILSL